MKIDFPQIQQTRDLLDTLEENIRRLDLLIQKHAAMLDLVQPYAPGKISGRYIKLRGGAPKEPVLVAWK